ncbi:MAG: hypothetical protein NVS9B10_28830 [Nevskia sp.]
MTTPKTPPLTPFALALSAFLTVAAPVAQAASSPEVLEQRLDALSQQVEALKAEIRQLKAQNEALAAQQENGAGAPGPVAAGSAAATGVSSQQSANPVLGRPTLFGYGEVNYNHYDHDSAATQATVRRAVFGIGYRYDERTRFVSEFEVENAIVSASDGGEFEVEQFYIDHRFNDYANAKLGLILIPSGYLNAAHEPPRYFGVERNFVETAIIPSTEREGGLALYGKLPVGLSYDVGLTTSFNLAKWDFSGADGRQTPLGSIHGELTNQRAADLAQYVAINYDGLRGLNLGGSVFTGEVGQNQPNINASPRFTLWETHARYERGPLHLQALYAHGGFSDTAALNLANAGTPTPIPKAFFGWYTEAAYRVWQQNGYALSPFLRYERFNTGSAYAAQPPGFGASRLPTESVLTYGFSFFLNPNVVLKADYRQFDRNKLDNRFNLGLGLQF